MDGRGRAPAARPRLRRRARRLGRHPAGARHRRARRGGRGAELLVTEIERVYAAVLDALPSLRLVATARGGPVNVDLAACAGRGIPVLFTPARNADSVADFTLGLLLSLVRGISASERHLRSTGWDVGGELPYLHFRGPELAGRTLGLVG